MTYSVKEEHSSIYVQTEFEGFHCWKKAPKEVAFLRNFHRHIFKVKVWFRVYHDDRDLEFFIMKRKLNTYINKNINKQDVGSFEMVCAKIAKMNRKIIKVEVSEDGENGAELNINYIHEI